MSITWSYTKFSTYEKCQEMYYRQYVLKEKFPENQRKFYEGYVLQSLFEEYVNSGMYKTLDKKWLYDHLDEHKARYLANINNHKTKFFEFKDQKDEDSSVTKLNKAIENTYGHFVLEKYNEWEIRSEVEPEDGGIQINDFVKVDGSIDFLISIGSDYKVLDLKLTKSKRYIQKDQLVFYALLVSKMVNKFPVDTYFFNAASNTKLNCAIIPEDVEALVSKLTFYTKEIEAENSRRLNLNSCWGCSFKEPCHAEHFGKDAKNGRFAF